MLEFENITSFPICLTYRHGGEDRVQVIVKSHSRIMLSEYVFSVCRDSILHYIGTKELVTVPAEPAVESEPPVEQTPIGTYGGRKLG